MLNGIVMKMMMVILRWNYQQWYKIIMLMECPGHLLTALGQVIVGSFTPIILYHCGRPYTEVAKV